jgi:Phage-related lysozyme (muraminidase)
MAVHETLARTFLKQENQKMNFYDEIYKIYEEPEPEPEPIKDFAWRFNFGEEGTSLLKEFEGFRSEAYYDIAGVLTIGYGETEGVKEGDTTSEKAASEHLQKRVDDVYAEAVRRCVTVPIDQCMFDAMTSLSYNIGAYGFKRSSVVRRLNTWDYEGAADAFLMWNKATVGGRKIVVRGLTRRREAERMLFIRNMV